MKKTSKSNRKPFCVIQFIELPFEGINDYVCVPQSWIISSTILGQKVIVAYPNDKDPLTIQNRAKKKEKYTDEWGFFLAVYKHESDTYEGAVCWITTSKNSGLCEEKQLEEEMKGRDQSKLSHYNVNLNDQYKWAVVQFLSPHANIDDYVCVPHSWILLRKVTDRNTVVTFPSKLSMSTKRRIENGEEPLETWKLYMAIIKYETNSYEDANNYIMKMKTGDFIRNEDSAAINTDDKFLPAPAANNISSSFKRINSSEPQSEIDKKKLKMNDKAELVNQAPNSSQFSEYSNLKSIKKNILHAPQNPLALRNEIIRHRQSDETLSYFSRDYLCHRALTEGTQRKNPNQTLKSPVHQTHSQVVSIRTTSKQSSEAKFTENKFPGTRGSQENLDQSSQLPGSLIEGTSTIHKTTTDKASLGENVDVNERTNSFEMSTEDLSTAGQISVEEADLPADSVTDTDNLGDQLANIFEQMDVDLSQAYKVAFELLKSLVRSSKTMKRLKDTYENFRNLRKKQFMEVQKVAEENQAKIIEKESHEENTNANKKDSDEDSKRNKDDDDGDDGKNNKNDKDDDEDFETPKKAHEKIRPFVLPPEYDPDDTRWTLKYRENNSKLGLVELMPRSKVFINSIRLAHCKRVSKDCKTLARMLLVEIFSQTALSVCSLTGARANAFDINGMNVRPGLDEHARMVILSFVEEHARQKNWGSFDTQSVINSIRSKIQEIRAKHSQVALP